MKLRHLLIFLLFIGSTAAPQQQNEGFQEKISVLQQKDSLESYIYTYLDEFLKDPGNLSLLDQMHQNQWRKPDTRPETLALTILLCNKGYYQMRFGRVAAAADSYEEAWRLFQQYDFKDFDIIEYCLKPLGNVYSMLGDYTSAENTIKSYLLRAQEQGSKEHITSAFINLSVVYHDTGQYEKAIEILQQAVDSGVAGKKGLVYSNLAASYLQAGNHRKAKAAALRALNYFKKEPDRAGETMKTYSTLSVISLHEKDTLQALQFLKQAKAMGEHDTSPRAWAKVNIQLAGILGATGNDDAALAGYAETLQRLIPGSDSTVTLPSDTLLYPENALKEIFDAMAAIYIRKNAPDKAIQCYNKSFAVEELLKATYSHRESKYLQQGENRKRAEQMIGLCHRQFTATRDSTYLQQAFEIAERTKAITLKDELSSRQSWARFSNDSLYLRKKELTRQKAWVENALIHEQLKGEAADMGAIRHYIDTDNKLTLDLKQLERNLEQRFGRITKTPELNLQALHDQLREDGLTLVEYFFGSDALYIFVVDGTAISLYKVADIQKVRETVTQYSRFFTDEVKINADPQHFARVSQKLYSTLFPFRPESPLLIIPDGLLNFFPFEALLTAPPSSSDYSKWPWLMTKAPLLYQYSAIMHLSGPDSRRFASVGVLGLFPQFEGTNRHLRYSEAEARHITEHFEGRFLQAHDATRTAFLRYAKDYPIIHLSTHASAGGLYEPPSVAFIDTAIYLPELYGLHLRTELLVLGACETGIGKLYKGEGPLSLANGFFHAGVRNIILSLWKVNDYSTAQLMAAFYQTYEEQPAAHLALHQAKLDYLTDEDIGADKKSPYYWASFVFYGSTESGIRDEKKFKIYEIVLAVLVLLSLPLLWRYRHRKGRKKPRKRKL